MKRLARSFYVLFLLVGLSACGNPFADGTSQSAVGSDFLPGPGAQAEPPVDLGSLDITQAFPGPGYYSGVGGSLTSANVCSGKSLLGDPGTAVCQAGSASAPAGAAHVLSGKEFWNPAGGLITGTMPVGANITGTNGSLSVTIPEGYYDGTKTATAADTSLVAGNIVSGATLFGVAGSATTESHSSCTAANQSGCVSTASYPTQTTPTTPAGAAHVLSGKEFYAGGAMITGTMASGSNVSGSNGSLSITIPEGYYDGTKTATTSDTGLTAGNICTSNSIFGVNGSATCQGAAPGTGSAASASDLCSGKYAWNGSGAAVSGTRYCQFGNPPLNGDLKIWLKAGDLTGLANGDPVDTWTDASGTGNHAAQSQINAPDRRPKLYTNVINGHPAVRFDGVDDGMSIVDSASYKSSVIHLFIVVKFTAGSNYVVLGYPDQVATHNDPYFRWVFYKAAGNYDLRIGANASPVGSVVNGSFLLLSYDTQTRDLYQNGALSFDGSGQTVTYPTAAGLRIGTNSIGTENLNGDIAEIMLFTAVTSRKQIECYLSQKYGIALSYSCS